MQKNYTLGSTHITVDKLNTLLQFCCSCDSNFSNVSTTPLRQWGFQLCMFIFELETLRGKHCRHPIAKMGVVWALNAEIAAEKCWNCEEKKIVQWMYLQYILVATHQY